MGIHKTDSEPSQCRYTFGSLCLQPDGLLLRDATVITLTPKELAILRRLLANAGHLTYISELRQAGWGETHVSADSLPRCISSLRARLEPDRCISTVYKRGYRLAVPVVATLEAVKDESSAEIVSSTLALNSDLPATAEKVSQERALPMVTGPRGLPRLAILPFRTKDSVPAHLGVEIAEATMLRLGRARTAVVDVLASSTVFELASRSLTTLKVGELSGAHLILAGTLTSQALHFRLRAEMFRIGDAVQLWVEDFFVPRELIHIAEAHLARLISARILQTFLRPNRPGGQFADPSGSNSATPDRSASPIDPAAADMTSRFRRVQREVPVSRSSVLSESGALEEALI